LPPRAEDIAAAELTELLGQRPDQVRVGTKHVLFATSVEVNTLRKLTTVDESCQSVVDPVTVTTADDLRDLLTDRSDFSDALRHIGTLRPLDEAFSVTVTAARSPVGSSQDIIAIVEDVVARRLGWQARTGVRAPVDVRVFLDGSAALIGVRVFEGPLPDRPYRLVHRKVARRPTVAAAMVRLVADDRRTHTVWDPFCGSGTILAEARLAGHTVYGSDLDAAAVAATTENLGSLHPQLGGRVERAERADAASEATGPDTAMWTPWSATCPGANRLASARLRRCTVRSGWASPGWPAAVAALAC
jgi:23S rRNA G2445 N2-methylase RlmL